MSSIKSVNADTNSVNNVTDSEGETNKTSTTKILGGLSAVTGIGAIIASSCCLVPLMLTAIGASAGVLSAFQRLAEWRYALLGIAGVTVIGGWISWWNKRNSSCCSASQCNESDSRRTTVMVLTISTAFIIIGLSWEYIEPSLLRYVRGRL